MSAATVTLPPDVRLMNASANLLWIAVALGLAAMAVAWAARWPLFNVRAIRVEGDVARNSVATIRSNAAPHLAGNLFTLDLAAARRAFESVPWVRQAVVRRVWPDRLVVQLEEHRAAAYWEPERGSDRLVDTYGDVFDANLGDVEDEALPTLRGPEGSSREMLALCVRLAPLVAALDGARIETLALSGRGSWRVALDSGATIELGRGSADQVVARTERFVRSVAQVTARYERALLHADLRHADGYAVRLEGITTTSAGSSAATRAGRRPARQ
jgi:cell division protein FtsQ